MTLSKALLFSSILLFVVIHQCTGDNNSSQVFDNASPIWENASIVPSILSSVPPQLCEVIFTSDAVIATGQQLNLSDVASQPQSIAYPWNSTELYTFIMFDPDSPSEANPHETQYAQWISVNNEGESATNFNTNSGQEIAPYSSPVPEKHTGKHRYIVLVYKQTHKINVQHLSKRTKFNVANFARQNGLGSPTCGNFFIAYAND